MGILEKNDIKLDDWVQNDNGNWYRLNLLTNNPEIFIMKAKGFDKFNSSIDFYGRFNIFYIKINSMNNNLLYISAYFENDYDAKNSVDIFLRKVELLSFI